MTCETEHAEYFSICNSRNTNRAHGLHGKEIAIMRNRDDALSRSAGDYVERNLGLGEEFADEWPDNCTDFGELTKAAHGHEISSDYFDDIWPEYQTAEFIEEFGGVPDKDLFIEGFYRRLRDSDMQYELQQKVNLLLR